ncbi:hypothetical protein LG290_10010 [Halomonas sediminis]
MKRLAWATLLSFTPFLYSHADESIIPAYSAPDSELLQLDNGVIIEGSNLSSQDTYTSGFRVTAGFSPWQSPRLDLGAELAYRASDEVPIDAGSSSMLIDTLSLGGALVAGIRMGAFSVYAKSGLTEWRGESNNARKLHDKGGTANIEGFGATMTIDRLVSRLEYERIDASNLSHLNQLTASVHLPF